MRSTLDLLSRQTKTILKRMDYQTLTRIQEKVIPDLLNKKNVVAQSKTGAGKTAAYLIPFIDRIGTLQPPPDLRVIKGLVICPTRELAAQVAREARKIGQMVSNFRVLELTGGTPVRSHIHSLERGATMIVGTPGRILDLISRQKLDLRALQYIILDEADQMLDLGFNDDILNIFQSAPPNAQVSLFSATIPNWLHELSQKIQTEPVLHIESIENQTNSNIQQLAYSIDEKSRTDILLDLFHHIRPQQVLIFCNRKTTVDQVEKSFMDRGIFCEKIHGGLDQNDRERVMAKLRNDSANILITTDIAARGIDIPLVDCVIHFDFPMKPEIYIHRMGRTGRADRSGTSAVIVNCSELERLEEWSKIHHFSFVKKNTLPRENVVSVPRAPMDTLYIGGGRKDKLRPGDILGALTGKDVGLLQSDVGKIEIHDRFSYVAVKWALSERALVRLRHSRIKNGRFQIERVR